MLGCCCCNQYYISSHDKVVLVLLLLWLWLLSTVASRRQKNMLRVVCAHENKSMTLYVTTHTTLYNSSGEQCRSFFPFLARSLSLSHHLMFASLNATFQTFVFVSIHVEFISSKCVFCCVVVNVFLFGRLVGHTL